MNRSYPTRQLCRPGGYHPVSVAVWTPEKNGEQGLEMALLNRKVWGGWVFESKTTPGYAVWFDTSYTPSEIMQHETTQGHSGKLH